MSEPNPTLIWETIPAHQRTAALKAGVELGVFDALRDGPVTAAKLASGAGVEERAMRILRDFLTVQGLITKADGHYSHTDA